MPVLVTSVPFEGPTGAAGRDAAAGAALAIEDAGAAVDHLVLDAGPGFGGPNAAGNARRAAADPDVVAYLGEFHSAATRVTLPLLEAAGVAHLSFSSTWRPLAGVSFFNVIPDDGRQAEALVAWMLELGVRRPYLLDDGEYYGHEMAWLVHGALAGAGIRVAGGASMRDGAGLPDDVGDADAFFVGTVAERATAATLASLHERAPDAPIFSAEGLVDERLLGELPPGVAAALRVTTNAARGGELPPEGQDVMARLAERVGQEPDTHALYAYEAAALALDALADAGPDRAAVIARLRATRGRESVLGTYDLDARGATTLANCGRLVVQDGRFVTA